MRGEHRRNGAGGVGRAPGTAAVIRRAVLTELRRSAVPWIGLLVAALAHALTSDSERWIGLWMAAVLSHHTNLTLLWPLAVAAGAWQSRRDRAARIDDLLASMSRPRATAIAPLLGALTACLAAGYAAGLADGFGSAVLAASYWPSGWYWTFLVGVLGIAAGGVLGFGLGRLWPSRLAPPLFAIGALVLVFAAELWATSGSLPLLVPGHLGDVDEYSMVDPRTSAGQAVWFGALAGTGYALAAVGTLRARLAAVLPVLLGLVAAIAVLPPADRAAPRDPRAVELVCADGQPRVCVTRVYEPALEELVGPARRALAVLARLPQAPTAVVQQPSLYGEAIEQRPDTVYLDLAVFNDGMLGDGTISPRSGWIEEYILEGAGTWACGGGDDLRAWDSIQAAREAAGLWLRGEKAATRYTSDTVREAVDRALGRLYGLPEDAQVARVAAMREAALACRSDLYDILTATP